MPFDRASVPVTDVMDRLIEIAAGQRLSVRDLIQAFGDRSLGALLVLPCLLVILPIGMIPGVPDVAALLMILIGAQMIAGMERLWLPSRLERVSFEGSRLIGGLQ
ncbi:MAG: exopolysaccharide biosynthesis protein, partial [Pseudomonadota bacterium]